MSLSCPAAQSRGGDSLREEEVRGGGAGGGEGGRREKMIIARGNGSHRVARPSIRGGLYKVVGEQWI